MSFRAILFVFVSPVVCNSSRTFDFPASDTISSLSSKMFKHIFLQQWRYYYKISFSFPLGVGLFSAQYVRWQNIVLNNLKISYTQRSFKNKSITWGKLPILNSKWRLQEEKSQHRASAIHHTLNSPPIEYNHYILLVLKLFLNLLETIWIEN